MSRVLAVLLALSSAAGFTAPGAARTVPSRRAAQPAMDLDRKEPWRVAISLDDAPELIATLNFAEDVGYEPPQGRVSCVSSLPEGVLGPASQLYRLSEDPDDPKDSLWIWGLFKEPLYPFLLCSVVLAEEWAALPAGTAIFLQAEHRRDPQAGTLLGGGTATVREALAMPGGADAGSAFEAVTVGTFRFLDSLEPKE